MKACFSRKENDNVVEKRSLVSTRRMGNDACTLQENSLCGRMVLVFSQRSLACHSMDLCQCNFYVIKKKFKARKFGKECQHEN